MKDSDFIEQAIVAHGDAVFRFACSLLQSPQSAEDATQEAFLKLFQSEKEFSSEPHLHYWLLAVTRNYCCDLLRRHKRLPILLVDPTAEHELEHPSAFGSRFLEEPLTIDEDHVLWRHVAKLPLRQREVIHLRYIEDFTPQEIEGILGISGINVRQRICRALKSLRRMLAEESEESREVTNRETCGQRSLRGLPKAREIAPTKR